jgi:hypothetical protein
MRRGEFITPFCGGAAWPLVARAQQPDGVQRIAVLQSRSGGHVSAYPALQSA